MRSYTVVFALLAIIPLLSTALAGPAGHVDLNLPLPQEDEDCSNGGPCHFCAVEEGRARVLCWDPDCENPFGDTNKPCLIIVCLFVCPILSNMDCESEIRWQLCKLFDELGNRDSRDEMTE